MLGNAARFDRLTGQQTLVGHTIVGWNQGLSWGSPFGSLLGTMGEIPMLGFGTTGPRGSVTPLQIAQGKGDAYLVAMSEALAALGRPVYVRPLGEMNGHWNPYCAFTASGAFKGPQYATGAFRKAFARIYLILHGGTEAELDARLARLELPPVGRGLTPDPTLTVVWNPQGYGSPDVPGNRAQAYYPGNAYVDLVGDDLYDIRGRAEWAAAEALYKAHPSKPFGFPEWGLWGVDDPSFVRRMAQFAKTHRRVRLLAYFDSKPGSIWDLASKPRSLATYRSLIVPLA